MINVRENEILLRCSCHRPDHIAFLIYEPDDSLGNNLKGESDDWYLTVMLNHHPFWGRVRKAIQYAFSPMSMRYGMTAQLALRNEDVDKLCEFIASRRRAS